MHYAFADRFGFGIMYTHHKWRIGGRYESRRVGHICRGSAGSGEGQWGRGIGECYGGHERTMKGKMCVVRRANNKLIISIILRAPDLGANTKADLLPHIARCIGRCRSVCVEVCVCA